MDPYLLLSALNDFMFRNAIVVALVIAAALLPLIGDPPAIVCSLDRAIHRPFNRVLDVAQKLLHVNRFQVLLGLIVVESAVPASFALLLVAFEVTHGWQLVRLFGPVVGLMAFLLCVFSWSQFRESRMSRTNLMKCSRAFEEGKAVLLPYRLRSKAEIAKERRPWWNIVAIIVLSKWLVETCAFGPLPQYTPIVILLVGLRYHLWDVDDVDPRNRTTILEPDTAKDLA